MRSDRRASRLALTRALTLTLTLTLAPALALSLTLTVAGCRRAPDGAPARAAAQSAPALSDPAKQVALHDLQQDLAATRAAVAAKKSPVYAMNRLALAAHELADERDDGIAKLLADAETVYGLDAPVSWANVKLKEAEARPETKLADCATAKEMLNRINAKFANNAAVLAIVDQYKTLCPRTRSSGGSATSSRSERASAPTVDLNAQRWECRQRCDRANTDCGFACPTCSSCTSDRTWEVCNSMCASCKQGCEQNYGFCKAQCGG